MLKDIKAAIFDMDGTLVDSMWVWGKIDVDYLAERNLPLPEDLRGDIEHLSFDETAKYFKDRFNLPDSIDEIKNCWNNMAIYEYTHEVKLKPGADKFLCLLKSKGIKIGLATSNCNMLLEAALKQNGIFEYFDCITTTNEVNHGKDHPDVYLLTAKKLGVSPENCIVFEDILPAIMGAKSAGMKVVGVHDAYSEHQKDDILKLADKYITHYNELIEAV